MEFTRNFVVTGRLECNFNTAFGISNLYLPDLEVELWRKSPLDVIFLGKGNTDTDGRFTVEIENNAEYIDEGKIDNVFLKVYYKGNLINGGGCNSGGDYNNDYNDDFLI